MAMIKNIKTNVVYKLVKIRDKRHFDFVPLTLEPSPMISLTRNDLMFRMKHIGYKKINQ